MQMQTQIRHALASAQHPALALDRLDAQWLLLHALGKSRNDRAWLLAHDDDLLAEPVLAAFKQLCARRASGEPLAYIVGYKAFFGLELAVDRRVLVPRPDTETLVQWALDLLEELNALKMLEMRDELRIGGAVTSKPYTPFAPFTPQILDLGTGSGAVAIALAHCLKQAGRPASVFAIDASSDALAVAEGNARRLQLDINFSSSHWLAQVEGQHHLIVSNPPYIADADPHLEALRHEPLAALTAGGDGLDDIRQIVKTAPAHLYSGGWLLLEHGYDQAAKVRELLQQGGFGLVGSRLDLAGVERCSGGRWSA